MLRCQQLLNLRILKIVLRGGVGSQESVLITDLSVVLRVWEGRKETPLSGSIASLLISELSGLRDRRRLLRQISYDTSLCEIYIENPVSRGREAKLKRVQLFRT